MLRNILLLIETTRSGLVAKDVAMHIASRGNCNLTGLEIQESAGKASQDRQTKSPRAMLSELTQQPERAGEIKTDMHDQANKIDLDHLANLNISYNEKTLFGPKYALLCQEAEFNDLTIIGRDGNVGESWSNVAKETINLMLDYRSKPIIITPPELHLNRNILIACDGSPGSSRAIQLFVLMGLADDQDIHVLSVSHKKNVAQTKAESIAMYLHNHGISSKQYAIETRADPSDVITDKIRETGASLVVAGAYGDASWRRSMFGSISEYLIRFCPVALFSCH